MTTKRITAISAAVLILILCPLYALAAENLLRNADFSELDSDGLPTGWYTDAYTRETGYTRFSVSGGDELHPSAVSIMNIGENDARFAQNVDVEPDSLYMLSGYIRADGVTGGHGANLSVEGVYAFSEKVYDTNGQWQRIEYYGETGPGQHSLTVFARLGGYSGVSTGTAYFADLSLTKVDSVPGDEAADLWFIGSDYEDDYDGEFDTESGTFRPQLLIIGILYTAAALYFLFRSYRRQPQIRDGKRVSPLWAAAVLMAGLVLRMIISWLTEGYMVDVNCFLSWGHTMASVGPARFYEATNFCDYPPLYTYVLALCSAVKDLLGGGDGVARIVFRFIPSVCDLAACLILFRMLEREGNTDRRTSFLFLVFAVFNPAAVINSAAWGQMDSVLCLLLLCVALSAIRSRWKAALPLYVLAVLVKPQALMLGPLGLAYIVLEWIRNRDSRRPILQGTLISLLTLAAGVIPFSLNQSWDWLIQLYARTLGSYPYATVNTANFWYLMGGNWKAVDNSAHFIAPVLLCIFCAAYGSLWYIRAGKMRLRLIETVISGVFAAGFLACALLKASWAWNGGLAMAFAFVIVLSPAVRSRDIRMLPWLGGLLYILLYVFGVKMHERYIFPALFLLAAAFVLLRDRRILILLILFTFTVFINEGIVLDNSIRLGSEYGHLNADTIRIADTVSIVNIAAAVLAVLLGFELLMPRKRDVSKILSAKRFPRVWDCDRKLHWTRLDSILLASVTAVYALVSLLTLGSGKAPQTCWSSSASSEQVIFDLGETKEEFEILYFAQVSRKDFSFSVSNDGVSWSEEEWAQMDQGQCWKWKYVTVSYENQDGERTYYNSDEGNIIRFTGRYVRLSARQLGLKINELLFRDEEGNVLPAVVSGRAGDEPASELYSDPSLMLDEQDTLEGLPALFSGEEEGKAQPSWWNSTYFDEIYHARTAYEFLRGTAPYETTHPPLGKVLMSFFVAVLGMTPFGWRFAGALAGILMLPGMYLLGKQLTKKTTIALLSCMLMALDCMHLTQSQIATIDSFPVLFIIFSYFFMLRFLQTDFTREKLSRVLVSLGLSGLFMGLSIASKWIGIYAGAGLAVLYFWHCIRMVRNRSHEPVSADREEAGEDSPAERDAAVKQAKSTAFLLCAWCVLFFVIVPLAIYLLSYIPYLAYCSGRIHSLWDYIAEVWRSQVGMFDYHSTPNLGMDHPFYSPWWQWPVIGKPMYYASEQYIAAENSLHHSIFCFGNPVIWFGGLAALLAVIVRIQIEGRKRILDIVHAKEPEPVSCDPRYAFVLIGLLAQYLPWVLVPRGTYIYHYFASLPFLMSAIALCFTAKREKTQRILGIAAAAFTVAAVVFFIILFPYASGMSVSSSWLDIGSKILRIWY